jgi:hypothetical protein
MRTLGNALMGLGVLVGGGVAVAMLLTIGLPNLSWFVAVGLVKLVLAGSLGLIGAGAFIRRFALRAETRDRLMGSRPRGERDLYLGPQKTSQQNPSTNAGHDRRD